MENSQKVIDHLYSNPNGILLWFFNIYSFSTCQTIEIMSLTKELDIMFYFIDESHEEFNVVWGKGP